MFLRYAIYYTATGPLASTGAAWLGRDIATGQDVASDVPDAVTQLPRKYGFHGTLKPPFALAEGMDADALGRAVAALSARLDPAVADGLEVAPLGRFLALVPFGDQTALKALAAQVVSELDAFRAPPGAAELARRRAHGLSPEQETNLTRWGYPHVMDQFRFHMTLTRRLPRAELAVLQAQAARRFAPVLPRPFVLDALALVGERANGQFEMIERFVL